MGIAQPIFLLKLGANFGGVNTRLLPEHVRPPLWRCAALIGTAIFYGFFVSLSV